MADQRHSGGNFANDRERAAEAGRKGGEHSHGGSHDSGQHGQKNAADKGTKGADQTHGRSHGSGNLGSDESRAANKPSLSETSRRRLRKEV